MAVRYPAVVSKLNPPANDKASLLVTALLKNSSAQPVKGTLKGKIENIEFSQDVELAANESKDVVFDPAKFDQLNFSNPKLWWPAQMGAPNLYPLQMSFEVGGQVSDSTRSTFGIREIKSELDANKGRFFTINGKKILIRGGGYTPDFMLRETPDWIENHFRYVLDMGLNTVRLEGKLSKAPSFWTRHVDIIRWYKRFAGVRMPVVLESTANVLIAGRSTFRMSYEYESVNHQRVGSPQVLTRRN